MKILLALTLVSILGLTACAGSQVTENTTPVMDFSSDISGEITVYTFDSMMIGPFLEEAARLFMYQNPDTVVNVESFSSMPAVRRAEGAGGTSIMVSGDGGNRSQERRDYINMVNTELMGGRGPDILALDVLPFHEYARIGQLADLRQFMDADPSFNINDYRVNIFDALTDEDGRQFIFPVDYAFRYAAYDSSLLTGNQLALLEGGGTFSFESLIEIGQMAEIDEHLFGMDVGPERGLFQEIFAQNYSKFIDIENRQANFNDGAFVDLLNRLVALEERGYIPPRTGTLDRDTIMSPDIIQQLMNERFAFKPRPSTLLLSEIQRQAGQQRAVMMVSGTSGLGNSEDDRVAGLMANDRGEIPFTVSNGLGINSNSQNQQLAWEFIKFVSSEAVTQSMRMQGLPTHIGAFEERAALSITGELFASAIQEGGTFRVGDIPEGLVREEMDATDLQVLADYIELVEYFTNQLNTFFTTDAIIEEIVMTEVEEFFNGSRTAEDIAQTLQSRINLVLNE